ncbi:MAG: TIGR03619 family F420-dependent LLM class oxidoreductase [Chloroflexi bacterium]|nr:TIGR03619 family F420-dependent LLM class oxidoreductase [Chloroflexota bacterium]
MKFGIGMENYGPAITFDAIRRVALAAEELGYDSIWTTDHILVPRAARDPYGRIFECMVTLAMVASITQRVRLGTSVIVLPMRNPVLFAKQVATIDAACGGRMIAGLGVGWSEPEFSSLNANFKNRGKRLDEDIQLLRTLWSNENVNFEGRYTRIADGVFAPPPAQVVGSEGEHGVPIWIGGNDGSAWRRAARLGDGWHPVGASPEDYAAGASYIREQGPARPFSFSGRLAIDMNPAIPSTFDHRGRPRRQLTGTDDDIRHMLREYAAAGLEYLVLFFPMRDLKVTLAQMERFLRDFAPEFEGTRP